MGFVKADKSSSWLRLAMFGVAGGGKTMSALRMATGIGGPIAVIDSEFGSSKKYADRFTFDIWDLEGKCGIEDYINAIETAGKLGYKVLVIDSLSTVWGELVEEVNKLANAKYKGNTWSAWSEGTPRQKRLLRAILGFQGHIIATMRSNTEWVTTTNSNGRSAPQRVGTKPEQGKNIEYEFDMLIDISPDHIAHVLKDRTGKYQDAIIEKPDEAFGKALAEWLSEGVPMATVPEVKPVQTKPATSIRDEGEFTATEQKQAEQKATGRKMSVNQLNKVREYQSQLDWKDDEVSAFILERMGKPGGELSREDADALLEIMQEELDKQEVA